MNPARCQRGVVRWDCASVWRVPSMRRPYGTPEGQAAQGRGFGTEAVAAALGWFDACIGGPLVAMIGTENAASLALAGRFGFTVFRQVAEEDGDVVLLRRG